MFATRMAPETSIHIHDRRTGELVGTVKVLRPKCDGGASKLGLDFNKELYEFRFEQRDKIPVVNEYPETFGDYEPGDFTVPWEACNGYE